jgi:hypothetical protein
MIFGAVFQWFRRFRQNGPVSHAPKAGALSSISDTLFQNSYLTPLSQARDQFIATKKASEKKVTPENLAVLNTSYMNLVTKYTEMRKGFGELESRISPKRVITLNVIITQYKNILESAQNTMTKYHNALSQMKTARQQSLQNSVLRKLIPQKKATDVEPLNKNVELLNGYNTPSRVGKRVDRKRPLVTAQTWASLSKSFNAPNTQAPSSTQAASFKAKRF